MTQASTFSIVTISFNQAAFLDRAIESVISQGVPIQYVVVDPGSTDGSREIIERYRDRIDVCLLEPDKGPADGLNRGLAVCTGEYFGFLNADDELLPNALAEAGRLLLDNPEVDVVCGDSWQVDEHGRRSRRLAGTLRVSPRLYARGVAIVIQQSAFMRTAAVRAVGGFDAANRTSWDGDLFYRMAAAGSRFLRVPRLWALFRIYGGSISGSGRLNEQYARDCEQMFRHQFGRAPGRADRLLAKALYLRDLATDPRGLWIKITNRLGAARG